MLGYININVLIKLRDIENIIDSNKNKGFKSSNKIYRKVFNKNSKESKAIDPFGDSYFYSSEEDETLSISITLPKSLLFRLDEYCDQNKVTRSRLIRKLIEYGLDLQKID